MSSQEQRPVTGAAATALGLLVAGLAVLGFGRFVQFDDRTGFGSNEFVLPLGFLAAVLAIAAIGVAARDRTARLWLGGVLAVLAVFLVWQSTTNEGFRFVWSGDEGQLFLFQVAVGLIALLLIATGLQPSRTGGTEVDGQGGAGRWLVRAVSYLAGTAVAVFVAFFIGADLYDDKYCRQVADCDADDLSGLVWGLNGSLIVLGVCLVLIVTTELVLRNRRQQERKVGTPA